MHEREGDDSASLRSPVRCVFQETTLASRAESTATGLPCDKHDGAWANPPWQAMPRSSSSCSRKRRRSLRRTRRGRRPWTSQPARRRGDPSQSPCGWNMGPSGFRSHAVQSRGDFYWSPARQKMLQPDATVGDASDTQVKEMLEKAAVERAEKAAAKGRKDAVRAAAYGSLLCGGARHPSVSHGALPSAGYDRATTASQYCAAGRRRRRG